MGFFTLCVVYIMYRDPITHMPYGHNHAVYLCSCDIVIDQCPCKSQDKEVIQFDTCLHGVKKFPSGYPVKAKRKARLR
jgi:hypothetical protein